MLVKGLTNGFCASRRSLWRPLRSWTRPHWGSFVPEIVYFAKRVLQTWRAGGIQRTRGPSRWSRVWNHSRSSPVHSLHSVRCGMECSNWWKVTSEIWLLLMWFAFMYVDGELDKTCTNWLFPWQPVNPAPKSQIASHACKSFNVHGGPVFSRFLQLIMHHAQIWLPSMYN